MILPANHRRASGPYIVKEFLYYRPRFFNSPTVPQYPNFLPLVQVLQIS
jgi:hypothetical protein